MKERKIMMFSAILLLMFVARDAFAQGREIIYRGKDPHNYVLFQGEYWRILRKENDGTVKMIRNKSIGKYAFDKNGMSDFSQSSLKKYLNSVYYFSIPFWERKWIQKHLWQSQKTKWSGKIGLITISEYDLAYDKENCENLENSGLDQVMQKKCRESNYLNRILHTSDGSWTMSGYKNATYMIKDVYMESFWQEKKQDIFPVIYLKHDVKWIGKGTKSQPYRILTR